MTRALRIAVVGARRRVQGTGEFVARWFTELGCRVEAIVGTSDRTVADATRTLREKYGIACRGYLSLDALLAAETVEVVAICSPVECHQRHLETALAAGCHVFCEKPLVWPASTARPIVEGFAARGLALELNTQWPWTLPAFERLHPGVLAVAERFEMELGPMSSGPRMVVGSGSHFLSLLRAIAGPGTLEHTRAVVASPDRLDLSTSYAGTRHHVEAMLHLTRCTDGRPRASYAVNGCIAERRIDPPFRVSFVAPGGVRRVEIDDPTRLTIEDFLRAVEMKRLPDVAAQVDLSNQLDELVTAACSAEREPA